MTITPDVNLFRSTARMLEKSRWQSLSFEDQVSYSLLFHVCAVLLLTILPKQQTQCQKAENVTHLTLILSCQPCNGTAQSNPGRSLASSPQTTESKPSMKSQSGKQLNHIAESLPRQLKSLSLNSQLPQGKWFPPHITAESPILGPQVPTPEPSHDSACKDLDPLIVEELESDFCKSLPIPSSPQQSRNSGPTNTPQCVTSISDANTQDILHDLSDAPFIAADYDGQTVEIVIHRPSSRPVPGLSEHKFALNTTVEVAHTLYSSVQLVECKRTSVSQSEPLHSSFNELVWWEWVQNGSALQASLPAVSIIARGQRADWTLPSDLEGLDIPDGTKIEPRLHYAANDTRLSDLHYVYDH